MPAVKLSISEVCEFEAEVSVEGSITSLEANWGTAVEVLPDATAPPSFSGDFFRTREVFASARGCAGALVFFTTTGGIEWPRELIEESGLIVCEVVGRL